MPTTLTKKTLANVFSAFTRASTAMRWNEQGVLESVAVNLPRIDHDPITMVTNLCTQSEFPNGVIDASGVNVAAVPLSGFLGFTTGIHFNGGAASAIARKSPTLLPNTTYTISAYVQMDDGTAPVAGAATSAASDFTLVIGNAPISGPNHTVVHVENNIYRVSAWLTTPASVPNLASGVWKYAAQSTKTFKTTGLQVEVGNAPSRYVKTLAAPVSSCLPRGLLMEEARTNFAFPSMMSTNPDYYTTTPAPSIFGGANARRYVTKGTGGPNLPPNGVVFSSTGFMCASSIVEVDPASAAPVSTRLIFYRTGSGGGIKVGVVFNLATGAITVEGGGYSIAGVVPGARKLMNAGPNGGAVWLCWIAQENAAAETLAAYPYPLASTTAADVDKSMFVHHFQLEAGAFPTSPIVTTTASATRAADSARIDKQDWFNPAGSTLVAAFDAGTVMSNTGSSSGPYYSTIALGKVLLSDGLLGMAGLGSTTTPTPANQSVGLLAFAKGGPVSSRNFNAGTWLLGGKVAVTSDAAEQQAAFRGALVNAAPLKLPMSAALAGVDRLVIQPQINGWLKSLRYYPRRLSDAELIAITAL